MIGFHLNPLEGEGFDLGTDLLGSVINVEVFLSVCVCARILFKFDSTLKKKWCKMFHIVFDPLLKIF